MLVARLVGKGAVPVIHVEVIRHGVVIGNIEIRPVVVVQIRNAQAEAIGQFGAADAGRFGCIPEFAPVLVE